MTPSALSSELCELLRNVGQLLRRGINVKDAFHLVPEMLDTLEPEILAKAEADIIRCAELYRHSRNPCLLARLWGKGKSQRKQLLDVARLEKLFIFHRDGRLRAAALRKFDGPISSPFMFAALSWRLNDWVPQVRAAAVECAVRCFPQTNPLVIARAALFLLGRRSTWSRWTAERDVVEAALRRPDVISALATLIIERSTGPNPSILRAALRNPIIDSELPRIATDAVQPAARAVAYQALIAGTANWPDGWQWRWIDKSMGKRRKETFFASRPIAIDANPVKFVLQALTDTSGIVRVVAMSGLIRHHGIIKNASEIACRFVTDPARGVRERAEFVLKGQNPAK